VIEAIFTIDNGIYGDREGFLRDSVYELADRLAAAFKVQEILLASLGISNSTLRDIQNKYKGPS